jgi:ABC-type glycerol-3-phosphate transport system permease component
MIGPLTAPTTRPVGRPRRIRGKTLWRLVSQILMAVAALISLIPIIWTLLGSLKTNETMFIVPVQWLPSSLNWHNYPDAFNAAPFVRYFLNSTVVAVAVTASTVFFGAMAGYGFSKFHFFGRDLLFGLILTTFMIPFPVIMIPLYVLVHNLGWLDSYAGIIIPGALSGFGVFMMRQFMLAIPDELFDAARMDSAGELRIFFTIVLPLTRPALAALAILTFIASWNNLLWPLIVIQSDDLNTIPLGLTKFSTVYSTNYVQTLAIAVIASIPVLVIFMIGQRQIINSLLFSGIKG